MSRPDELASKRSCRSSDRESLFTKWHQKASDIYAKWSISFQCLERHQVEEKSTYLYILDGYREEHKSLGYYAKSIFYRNNQSANVWTHLIPFLWFVYRYARIIDAFDNPFDPIHYPFYVHGLGVCFLLLISTLAHTFCSRSSFAAEFCFGVDFAAIFIYGISCMVALESYLCPIYHYCNGPSTSFYFIGMVTYSAVANALGLYVNTAYRRMVPIVRGLFCAVGMLTLLSPCAVRYSVSVSASPDHPTSLVGKNLAFYFFSQLACLVIACGFYATRFPESKFPRTFDNIGNSHNWFHVFTTASMHLQSLLLLQVLEEIKNKIDEKNISRNDFEDSSWIGVLNIFVLSVVFLMLTVLWYFYGSNQPKKAKFL